MKPSPKSDPAGIPVALVYRPMEEIVLSSERLQVVVLPESGARLDSLFDLQSNRQWVWHPAGYRPAAHRLEVGASFDDNWQGGWEDIFPNDAEARFQGRSLAPHGELWSQAWKIESVEGGRCQLTYSCQTVPVTITKTVSLGHTNRLKLEYAFENQGTEPIPFLFKLHPAVPIYPGDKLLVAPCKIRPVDLGFSTRMHFDEWTSFPRVRTRDGQLLPIDVIPPRGNDREFFYCSDLSEGWCGIQSGSHRLVFEFNRSCFPYVWFFQSYGGWNGHYVVVPEPSTTMPWDLEKAVGNHTCAVLPPGAKHLYSIDILVVEYSN